MDLDDVVGGQDRRRRSRPRALVPCRRGGRQPDGVAQVRRAVVAVVAGGAHRARDDDRLGARHQQVEAKAVSSMTSVPWTTTAPATSGRASVVRTVAARSSSWANERCEAGTRPQSTASTVRDRVQAGVRARIAAPSSVGHGARRPPGRRMEMVPPVKTTATRLIGCSGPASSAAAAGSAGRADAGAAAAWS